MPLLFSFIRLPLLLAAALTMTAGFAMFGIRLPFPLAPVMATMYFTVVNIVCLLLLVRVMRREKRTWRGLTGFRKERLFKDFLYGLLWLAVLYLPFVGAVMGAMGILFGADMFNAFEIVFAPGEQTDPLPLAVAWTAAIVSAVLFPLLNAPVEEIFYRGYAQPRLQALTRSKWLGIVIPAVGFSLQHMMLAGTWEGAVVYAAAFFVWGVGAGLIYHRQKRLMPLIFAHGMTNLLFGVIPLAMLFV